MVGLRSFLIGFFESLLAHCIGPEHAAQSLKLDRIRRYEDINRASELALSIVLAEVALERLTSYQRSWSMEGRALASGGCKSPLLDGILRKWQQADASEGVAVPFTYSSRFVDPRFASYWARAIDDPEEWRKFCGQVELAVERDLAPLVASYCMASIFAPQTSIIKTMRDLAKFPDGYGACASASGGNLRTASWMLYRAEDEGCLTLSVGAATKKEKAHFDWSLQWVPAVHQSAAQVWVNLDLLLWPFFGEYFQPIRDNKGLAAQMDLANCILAAARNANSRSTPDAQKRPPQV